MKKIFFILLSTFLFANFLQNKTYKCENIGVSIKKNGKDINIPNNEKTQEKLKQILDSLYSISIKIEDKNLSLQTKDVKDTLFYFKDYKGLKVYATTDGKAFLFLDKNSSVIILAMPTSIKDNTKIYYKCK